MGYRNKTYVIFDGDKDMWSYGFMRGWKKNENVDFDFYDAHEINKLLDSSSEETVKRKLRERLANTKQAIVLIGDNTKNLHRYVRWELEACLNMGIPIVAVNLNGKQQMDPNCIFRRNPATIPRPNRPLFRRESGHRSEGNSAGVPSRFRPLFLSGSELNWTVPD